MLVLGRKVGQRVLINGNIRITVVKVVDGKVTLGLEAPPEVAIVREELIDGGNTPKEGEGG